MKQYATFTEKIHCQQSQKLVLGACTKITEYRDGAIV